MQPDENNQPSRPVPPVSMEPDMQAPPVPAPTTEIRAVQWSAKEHVEHDRNKTWYIWFALVIAVLIGISIWLQSWAFIAVIVVMTIALVLSINRPAATMNYVIDREGVTINGVTKPYESYKAFGILNHGGLFAVQLVPRKRLSMGDTLYFEEKDGEAIVDTLGAFLPMQTVKPDLLDEIVHMLRL